MRKEELKFSKYVQRLKRGDPSALKYLYNRYAKLILYGAFVGCGSETIADDILSEFMVYILQHPDKFEDVEYPRSYIFKVAQNLARNYVKKFQPPVDDSAEYLRGQEDSSNLIFMDILKGLPQDEQEILTLKFVYNYTFDEIAEILRMPTSTVSTMYYRSLERLEKRSDIRGMATAKWLEKQSEKTERIAALRRDRRVRG